MANITLVTASGSTVTPKDDGLIYEVFSPGNGLIYGGVVSIKDSSTLHITAGHGIVCGRKFTIDDADIPVVLSGSGTLNGRLYIHLDLADVAEPIALLVETGSTLSPEVRDSDVNINNGVYDINIATFTVSTTTIADLVNIDNHIAPIDFGTADISGIGDGSIKGAISELNAELANGPILPTITTEGATTVGPTVGSVLNNTTYGNNCAVLSADREGGNLRLVKNNDTAHLEMDTAYMNGTNGYARLYVGKSGAEATKAFQFNEDGSFTDGNGVNTSALAATASSLGDASTKTVANNLTTTAAGYVLDARQGKTLLDALGTNITIVENKLSGIPEKLIGTYTGASENVILTTTDSVWSYRFIHVIVYALYPVFSGSYIVIDLGCFDTSILSGGGAGTGYILRGGYVRDLASLPEDSMCVQSIIYNGTGFENRVDANILSKSAGYGAIQNMVVHVYGIRNDIST